MKNISHLELKNYNCKNGIRLPITSRTYVGKIVKIDSSVFIRENGRTGKAIIIYVDVVVNDNTIASIKSYHCADNPDYSDYYRLLRWIKWHTGIEVTDIKDYLNRNLLINFQVSRSLKGNDVARIMWFEPLKKNKEK